ncbi:NAD(P)-binding domain-containing protein [Pyramidobacter piscolens]|uniref:NAD(P)-binding domain-containing protein n=1 Tax=Pyramidobacter piscolens TaxID=638849 RepID=UPI0028E48045|nr:NAD(P)-binding domain-containing protein [Pyramidobacter piscolens]
MSVTIGYIGFGEAAYHMGKGLKSEGVEDIRAFDVALGMGGAYKDTVIARCANAGVAVAASAEEIVKNCDIVVICVPARFTASTAEGLLPFAKEGQLFVDVTTALPHVKEKEAALFAEKKAQYVDSAMLGSLVVSAHKVPMLASGNGAERWKEAMTPYGMKIALVGADSKAGEASRIKLVRSVFMKGFEALVVETFLFARKCGVEERIMDSVAGTMDKESFKDIARRMAGADLIHSERRSFEVGESMELMKEVGVEPLVAAGAKERLARSAALGMNTELNGVAPQTMEAIYSIWEKKSYK